MKRRLLIFAFLLLLTLSASLMSACNSAEKATEAVPENTDLVQTPAPSPSEEPSPEPSFTPSTPEERAAVLGLPAPPDIDIRSWEFLYAGISQGLGPFYHPAVRNIEEQLMDSRATEPTHAFLDAARAEGYTVYINAAYRNYEYLSFYFFKEIDRVGSAYEAAQIEYRFPPGTSEHSTGLAIDITDEPDLAANYYEMHDLTVKDTEVYKWMAEHCHEYGFIVRYPEGKEAYYEKACYPGHFRYVGVEAATYIMENNLCFEEFLALYK